MYWPQLAKLTLGSGTFGAWLAKPVHLMDFLIRHKETLQNLSIYGFRLTETRITWADIAESMRQDLPGLEIFHLGMVEELGMVAFRRSKTDEGVLDGKTVYEFGDCGYRRRQLDVLERWVLLKAPYCYESVEQRQSLRK